MLPSDPLKGPFFADEVTQVGSTAIDAQEEGITVPCPDSREWIRVYVGEFILALRNSWLSMVFMELW